MERFCIWLRLVLLGLFFAGSTVGSLAATKVALIIGNSDYRNVSALPNPVNDAEAIAASFARLGFQVTKLNDASRATMREGLADFSDQAIGADVGVVFFAGHGIEVDRQNYLIPVDAKLKTDNRIRFEAVPLDDVLASLDGVKGLRMVLLDACRDNPFAETMKRSGATRSIGRGLGRVEPTVGTLVSFAAKEGTTASDGDGNHSPYTTALLNHIEQPGLEVNFLFRMVRDGVIAATNGRQEPFTYGSLPGKEIFLKAVASDAKPADPNPNAPGFETLFWESVRNSEDGSMYRAYLKAFPDGIFKQLALLKLKQLEGGEDDVSSSPKVETPSAPPRQVKVEKVRVEPRFIPIGTWPEGIVFTKDALWVSESGQRTIARIDGTSSKIQRTKVGRLPVGMVADTKGNIYALLHTDRKLWKQASSATKGKALVRFKNYPTGLIAHGDEIWVVTNPDQSSGTLRFHQVDPDEGLIASSRTLKKGVDYFGNGTDYAAGASKLWASFSNGDLMGFGKDGLANLSHMQLPAFLTSVVVSGDVVATGGFEGSHTEQRGKIYLFNTQSGELILEHAVSERISVVSAQEGYFIAVGSAGTVWVIDEKTGDLLKEIMPSSPISEPRGISAQIDWLAITSHSGQGKNGVIALIGNWKPN